MLNKEKKNEKIRRKSMYVEILAIGRLFDKVQNRLDLVIEHCQIKEQRAAETDERKRTNDRIKAKMKRMEKGKLREAADWNRQNLTQPNGNSEDEMGN